MMPVGFVRSKELLHPALVKAIDVLTSREHNLVDVIFWWFSKDNYIEILLTEDKEAPLTVCCYSFVVNKDSPVLLLFYNIADCLKECLNFMPLKENYIELVDSNEVIPDMAWFESRNEALNISLDCTFSNNLAPAESIQSIIYSYVLSNKGFVTISYHDSENETDKKAIINTKYLIGDSEDKGWSETFYVFFNDLKKTSVTYT